MLPLEIIYIKHSNQKIYNLTVIFEVLKNPLFSDNPGQFSLGQMSKCLFFLGYSTSILFSPPPSDQCWIEYMPNASVCIRGLQHCVRGAGKLLFWKIRQCFYQKNSIFAFVPNELSQIVWEHLKIEKSNFCYYKRFKTCKMDWL